MYQRINNTTRSAVGDKGLDVIMQTILILLTITEKSG
jgi:hypothetical protein